MLRRSIVLSVTLAGILASVAVMTAAAADDPAPGGTGAGLLEALARVPDTAAVRESPGLLPGPGDPCRHATRCGSAGLHRGGTGPARD